MASLKPVPGLADHRSPGIRHLVEDDLAGGGALDAELVLLGLPKEKPGSVLLDDEGADAVGAAGASGSVMANTV